MAERVPPAAEPLTPEQIAELETMAAAIPPGPEGHDVAARLTWLVELLIRRGQLGPGHSGLVRRVKADHSPARVHLTLVADKRAVQGSDVDCASLMHLCKARCCAMDVALSRQDIEEGRLRWDLDKPYLLAKNLDNGYCANLRPDGGCCAYDDRPAVCRQYDCRNDKRVWVDFEKRIPVDPPHFVVPLGEWDTIKSS